MKLELADRIKLLGNALNVNDVQYLFIGGVAISYYGSPRPSSNLPANVDYDVDVWYFATYENFENLKKAIISIQPDLEKDLNKLTFDPRRAFIKFDVDNFHFDFLPELKAFFHRDFEKCHQRKETGKIEEVVIDIISKNDLLIDKQASGRDQDLADIENLKKNSYKGFVR